LAFFFGPPSTAVFKRVCVNGLKFLKLCADLGPCSRSSAHLTFVDIAYRRRTADCTGQGTTGQEWMWNVLEETK